MQKNKKLQSHHLTHQELKDLQYDQMNGEQEFVTGNKNSEFEIPAVEQHLIHANIELKTFNTATGTKTSVPRLQTFYPAEFKKMEDQGAFIGYSVDIIHEPEEVKRVKDVREDKSNLSEAANLEQNNADVLNKIKAGEVVGGPIGGIANFATPIIPAIVGTDDSKKEKPLSQLNKAELKAKYKEVWGEDPADDSTNPELLEAIKEKLAPNTNGE